MTGLKCPSESDILSLAQGLQPAERRGEIIAHLGACEGCRLVVCEASHALAPFPRVRGEIGTFSAGAVLGERYRINRRIGSGGMGEVYEATDLLLNEPVACKTLVCSALDDDRAGQRLRSEVLLSRRVSHPNVCRIFEFGICKNVTGSTQSENVPFFTMELLGGQTLAAQLAMRKRLTVDEAAPLVQQMLDGIGAIHAKGIVHRDFKTDNIFVIDGERGRRVVITDFGLACGSDLSRSLAGWGRSLIGTLDYMAPEQLLGSPTTSAVDIYALGVVLFEMFAGRRPFACDNPVVGAVGRLRAEAPSLSSVFPGVGGPWERVIARCLARDPLERYATVDAIRSALFPSVQVRGGASRARLVPWGLSAAGLGLLGALVLRQGAAKGPPEPAAIQSSSVTEGRNALNAGRALTPAPPIPTVAEFDRPLTTPARPAQRSTRSRRLDRSAPVTSHAEEQVNSIAPTELPPIRQNSVYSPRFDARPFNPSLGADGLPNPFAVNH